MTLPPYLAIHLTPLYSLFNLSPIVATDPTVPTDPLHPQPSPTVPPLHLSPPSAEAAARTCFPCQHLPSIEQAQTLSFLQIFQHHSPPVSNPPAPLVNSIRLPPPVRPPPPPPRTHVTSNPTAGLPLPSLLCPGNSKRAPSALHRHLGPSLHSDLHVPNGPSITPPPASLHQVPLSRTAERDRLGLHAVQSGLSPPTRS